MPRIALVLHGSSMLYEVAIASEIFGGDHSGLAPGGEWYDLVVCTPDGAPHPWLADLPTASYDAIAEVDTVVVPSSNDLDHNPDLALLDALRAAHERGARIASLCTGSFVLAAAGLLDGRIATTHWLHADELARRYPRVDVRPDVLYVDEGDVLTSAGKTAALDLCVHVVRSDLGAAAANGIARNLVVPAHRTGGQAQFITPPAQPRVPDGLAPTLEWARARLDQPLTVRELAAHAGLSTRQLARRMQAELQAGPLDWLHHQRISRAQELLERTDASIDQIAASCGMGTAATLRRHFHRTLGVTPTTYRTTFRLAD
ncbi:Transcriptional regulator GlxA family, contains an amidase domain and an AraC-type DNA-binding HTH domain [Nocardioides sp. YR527]|uniref:GlxA family transcriptional regulator n=1 Tax=Nocardioides sp. YR527 TaxID=1881028 RepID=UPI000886C3E5|nr:helix-turn-helix domain-containing protein [Nocardioides sp. YR527]SDL17196.1 Transcriptional regulator GlxA family, contains an amidase domain and an AraC-type DNA-binding HTH domain [Nocardioides sp. YR527]